MSVHRFTSMGCEIVVGGASAAERRAIEQLFDRRDRMFSRFRADSELNRVNSAAGSVVAVSEEFGAMLRVALGAARSTRGLVDPTLGTAIDAAGYGRDFSELASAATFPMCTHVERRRFPMGTHVEQGRWSALRAGRRALSRPPGVLLDLNGVVKGKTVDDALELIAGDGFVSAGGDIVARGRLDVALPGGGAVRILGGLATSSSAKRRWLQAGTWQHHLIDPATGRPAESPWRDVTVGAATCLQADVAAKAAFLLGDDGPRFIDERGLAGRFLAHTGVIVTTRRWPVEERIAA